MDALKDWFNRYLSDPQVVFLTLFLIIGFGIVIFMGDMLAPVLASVVIAYLLEGLVVVLENKGINRILAVLSVYVAFMAFLLFIFFGVMPSLVSQATQLVQQLPSMISRGHGLLMELPSRYPDYISAAQISDLTSMVRTDVTSWGQSIVSWSLASVVGVLTLAVYLVLMPLLVFFFLKDKDVIVNWLKSYAPRNRALASDVWSEVDAQIGNYVRGKFWEILVVGVVTFITFFLMGQDYAMLLSALVGLSVIIPYVGAVAVTIPVIMVAFFQWGWGADFAWIIVAYGVIQAIDGNVLVPLLFSEVVNLHPVAIMTAILVFGGLWGLLGVFF
ncbi:MAG TPA: AI-2E family transporter, partial [Chromatiaceae bacterium]|nr:AI-2E family transporter [Chromatiaceae bacterium]